MVKVFSCKVVGLDVSRRMIQMAKKKPSGSLCSWTLGNAQHLPFRGGTFDLCLLSMVIHHIEDSAVALAETFRVLVPAGRVIMRTCSHEQLGKYPDYYFFPRALAIDLARLPDVPVLIGLLQRAGFERIDIREIISPSLESSRQYIQKLRSKHTSTLHLLSEKEYREGLEKAERYFLEHDLPNQWRTEPITIIAASKPTM